MSVNPKFEKINLSNRCFTEIQNFFSNNIKDGLMTSDEKTEVIKWLSEISINNFFIKPGDNVNELTNFLIYDYSNNTDSIDTIISKKENMIELLKQLYKYSEIKDFNYLEHLHKLTENKNDVNKMLSLKLWILRIILFYLLLIYATYIFTNEEVFKKLYSDSPKPKRIFNEEVSSEIESFELGIFGSSKTTSDIDVGIRYVGTNDLTRLGYVVSIVEDLFQTFIGVKNSLALDIEPYADMYILLNWDTCTKEIYPDMFFLNTSQLTDPDFKTDILPYVYASIIRNYIKSKYQENTVPIEHKDKIKKELLKDIDTTVDIFDVVKKFDVNDLKSYNFKLGDNANLEDKNTLILDKIKLMRKTEFYKYIKDINTTAFDEGYDMTFDYMSKSYDDSREKYYEIIQGAEEILKSVRTQIYTHFNTEKKECKEIENIIDPVIELDKKNVTDCMKKIMHSLIYRQESYVCPSTITHIVRTIQAKSTTNATACIDTNTLTTVPNINIYTSINPKCVIGDFGYIISALEQYGYLLRFYSDYCGEIQTTSKNALGGSEHVKSLTDDTCIAKNKKYILRLVDAVNNMTSPNQTAGKRRTNKIRSHNSLKKKKNMKKKSLKKIKPKSRKLYNK